ncbi:hypothetical protein [Pseudohoeflea coraliihabitans]|uniref:Uncharacterized protein n=1 Tax=Pseudohoeflea coraliihabitans TaxID=2860393 RepID=A0ABS6WJM3_9HYPH|nr:hypothetical protein [Pseudohoeflea sp. DP4N28-3]MBW3096055.1 hypothetical protein [Pseudohoeflea sp. DP4N28-3]
METAGIGSHVTSVIAKAGQQLANYERAGNAGKGAILRQFIERVDLAKDRITITWNFRRLVDEADDPNLSQAGKPDREHSSLRYEVVLPIALKRRGVEAKVILANGESSSAKPDPSLIQLIAKAHCYLARLTDSSGRSLSEVARRFDTDLSEVSRILPLAFLAPALTTAILAGKHPASLTTQRLLRMSDLPLDWRTQSERFP